MVSALRMPLTDRARSPVWLKVTMISLSILLGCCLVIFAVLFAKTGGEQPVHAPQATADLISLEESVVAAAPHPMPCYGSSEAVLPGRSGVQRRRRYGLMCSCRRRSGTDSNGYHCSGGTSWRRGQMLAPPADGPNTVYIIRHAEKLSMFGCLSCQGHDRANNLANLFNGGEFQKPKAIFAFNYSEKEHCERALATAQPLAAALGITVDGSQGGAVWHTGPLTGSGMNVATAEAIKHTLATVGGPVLVVWESLNIPLLAYRLGGPPALNAGNSWNPRVDYDSVFTLTFDSAFNIISFDSKGQQNYSPPQCDDS